MSVDERAAREDSGAAVPTSALRRVRPRAGSIEHRDPAVDALRVAALAAVVLGHWLVTALVPGAAGLSMASPLLHSPELLPTSWFLQTVGPLFFAAGFAAARSDGRRPWSSTCRALALLLAAGCVLTALAVLVVPGRRTAATVVALIVSPLWFLGVLALLTSGHRVLAATATCRPSAWLLLVPATALVVLDAAQVAHGHAVLSAVQAVTCWSIPYGLGVADAHGLLPRRRCGAVLLTVGVVGVLALVLSAGHPTSAVGVPGQPRSNLNPPSAAALSLLAAQVGAFLLLRRPLSSLLRGDRVRRALLRLNRAGVRVYLLHQPVLLTGAVVGLPGVLGAPSSPGWLQQRALAVPVLALALMALVAAPRARALSRHGAPPRSSRSDTPPPATRQSGRGARQGCRSRRWGLPRGALDGASAHLRTED